MSVADDAVLAETLKIHDLIKKTVKAVEKSTNLSPVFLKRDNFAANAIPTGSLCLDAIIGGGIPAGRIIGISGDEATGKSLLATEAAANQLQAGRMVVYFDAEGGNDPLFLKARGIDFEKYRGKRNEAGELVKGEVDFILYYQPETGEQVRDYMFKLMEQMPENRSPRWPPILFVLDSVVALITDTIGDVDKNKMAMHAKMYAEMLPWVNGQLARTGCTLIYTNQLRQRPMAMFGDPTYEPAGDSLKFFSSIRLRLTRSKPKTRENDHPFIGKVFIDATPRAGGIWEEPHFVLDDGEMKKTTDKDTYNYTSIKCIKNKVYNPFKFTWIRICSQYNGETGHGLDPVYDVFTFLLENGLIEKAKARPTGKGKEKEKAAEVADMFEFCTTEIDHKELLLPDRFTYHEFQKIVLENKALIVQTIREKFIISGLTFKSEGAFAPAADPGLDIDVEVPPALALPEE